MIDAAVLNSRLALIKCRRTDQEFSKSIFGIPLELDLNLIIVGKLVFST